MSLELRLLGPLTLSRDGREVDLPASRKARALLAYLALSPRAVPRQRLCTLLWETAADPRGELRWHLSKLRAAVGASAISGDDDRVRLEIRDVFIDALEVQRDLRAGLPSAGRALELHALLRGEFLEGMEIERCPEFTSWLLAQRRRFRAWRVALLERLADTGGEEETCRYLEQWLALAPFDVAAHERLFAWFARRRKFRDGDEHLVAATRAFRAEGLDCEPLRAAWRGASSRRPCAPAPVPSSRDGEEAYDCYLLGRQHLARMMHRGLDASRRMFDRALARDPDYAPAWAGLATVHVCLYEWFDAGSVSLTRAEHASRRSLELAPQLAEAHVALGMVRSQTRRHEEAMREFDEAVRINPYLFDAYYYDARAAFARGDMARAAQRYQLAAQARPEDFQSAILARESVSRCGREDQACDLTRAGIRRAELVLALNPQDGRALSLGAGALFEDGQIERALEWAQRALQFHPDDTSALVNAACLYAKVGEPVRALDLLEKVFARGCGQRDWVVQDPDYASLRCEPRFQRLIANLR